MNEVCLAGTAFHRRCGHVGLKILGASAEHSLNGFAHGLFFQFPHQLLPALESSSTRACHACGAEDGCVDEAIAAAEERAARAQGMLPQAEEDVKASAASMVVVTLAIIFCCVIAVFTIVLRRKLLQWAPQKEGLSDPEAAVGFKRDFAAADVGKSYGRFEDEGDGAAKEDTPPLTPRFDAHDAHASLQEDRQDPGSHEWCPMPPLAPPQTVASTVNNLHATAGSSSELDLDKSTSPRSHSPRSPRSRSPRSVSPHLADYEEEILVPPERWRDSPHAGVGLFLRDEDQEDGILIPPERWRDSPQDAFNELPWPSSPEFDGPLPCVQEEEAEAYSTPSPMHQNFARNGTMVLDEPLSEEEGVLGKFEVEV